MRNKNKTDWKQKNSFEDFLSSNLFIQKYFWRVLRAYSLYTRQLNFDILTLINYYILRKRGLKKIAIKDPLIIVPSTICTAKCIFCAYRLINDKKKIMDFDIFKKAVDEFAKLGGKQISFTPTVGEALTDPGIFEKIKYAHKKGLFTSLFSNCTLLNSNKNVDKIISSGIDFLVISIGDIKPDIESKIFGISEEVAKSKIEGIFSLINKKYETNAKFKLIIGFRARRKLIDILNDIKKSAIGKFYNKGVFEIRLLYGYDNWGGMIKQSDLSGVQKLRKNVKLKLYPCNNLYLLSILPEGKIRLCGCRVKRTLYDSLIIGDLKKENLQDLLHSKKWLNIIKDFKKGKYPEVCQDCSMYAPKI